MSETKGTKDCIIEYIKDYIAPKTYAHIETEIIDKYGSYSDQYTKWTWSNNLNILTDIEDIRQILGVFYNDVDKAIDCIIQFKTLEIR